MAYGVQILPAGDLEDLHGILGLPLRDRHYGVYGVCRARRAADQERVGAVGQAHRLEKPRETEDMVTVEMGDQDGPDLHERERREHQLTLRTLPAVEEDYVRATPQRYA